jgi:8-oxo-dGTP diphosphatase
MVVSSASESSFEKWILGVSACLAGERVLVQIREKGLDALRVQHLLSRALARAEPFGAPVVVNSDCGHFAQAHGVHLSAAALARTTERPVERLVGASCHTRAELEKAAALGLDYVVAGPVKPTPSHPGAPGIGWDAFAVLVQGLPMPVYAIGGLTRGDLAEARRHGAHGVALRSAAFA